MSNHFGRREFLQTGAAAAVLTAAATKPLLAEQPQNPPKIKYCLNTSTVRGHNLSLVEEIELAAKAGYTGIEPWIGEITKFQQQGGKLADLKSRIADAGLSVESAIGFANWIVDDDQQRAKGLEAAKTDMDLVRQVGGTRIAAPPAGATNQSDLDLFRAAERYRALCELGEKMEVTPQLEVWGFSQSLSRLGEVLFVASEAAHPRAKLLPDVYHIYKGGSDFAGLQLIDGAAIEVFHMNDYPAEPPRETIRDSDRVYPGDGVAPVTAILKTIISNGFAGTLSLELFNPAYYQRPAAEVARMGLEKMQAAVAAASA